MQFNFYDQKMLLDAKRTPEKYGNLMVRVAGYSAPFVSGMICRMRLSLALNTECASQTNERS